MNLPDRGSREAGAAPIDAAERRRRDIRLAALLLLYVVALAVTQASFRGDETDWVDSVTAHLEGRDVNFWEAGHLLWRPLGLVSYRLLGSVARPFVGDSIRGQVTWSFEAMAAVAGAVALIGLFGWIESQGAHPRGAVLASVGLLVTQAFLDYAQAGTPYVPALAAFLVALWAATDAANRSAGWRWRAVIAGLALTLSICLWLPFVLVAPAACLAAPMLRRRSASARTVWSWMAATCFGATAIGYLMVLRHLRDLNFRAAISWFRSTQHGITAIGGIARAALGFARSVVDFGDVGLSVKQILLHDPLHRPSHELWLPVIALVAFYVLVAALLLRCAVPSSRRKVLAFFALCAVPVAGFAIAWQGGDMERWLALFPALALCVATITKDDRTGWASRLAIAGIAIVAAVNLDALNVWTGESRCAAAGARLAPLLARLHHEDAVVTPYSQDEAIWFTRNCPFTPAALQQHVEIWSAVSPGSAVSKEWRRRFAQRALTAWGQGGSVWLAERALRPTPRGNWNWVDGDDPFVRWRQFSEFFGQLDLADTIGGADGFVRVVPTVHTRDVLAESASP